MSSTDVALNVEEPKRTRPSRKAAESASTALKEMVAKKPAAATKKSDSSEPKAKRGRPAKEAKDVKETVKESKPKAPAKKAAAKSKAKPKAKKAEPAEDVVSAEE